jgi:orotidine-5'-phosphate decarboxylase
MQELLRFMNFLELLKETAKRNNSVVCFGLDPVIEKIPILNGNDEKNIVKFYSELLDAVSGNVGAVKLNYAFFGQYGFPGLRALEKVIDVAKGKKLPVILDAKRGDIGPSTEAYAKEVFDFWKADAVTVSPYMGEDSIKPFQRDGKGVYVLVRTSNPSAGDFQNKDDLYIKVAKKVIEWKTGAVVGATSVDELGKVSKLFCGNVPMLIPGVGTQGGSAKEVFKVLRDSGGELGVHRINSSSGISYAYEKEGSDDYVGAAVKAVKELNDEIGF